MQPAAAAFQPVEGKMVSLGKVHLRSAILVSCLLMYQERNDHVEIYYEVYGTGPDKIVLIMGAHLVLCSGIVMRASRPRNTLQRLASHASYPLAAASQPSVSDI